jgi:plastocyanin domain-containing protein
VAVRTGPAGGPFSRLRARARGRPGGDEVRIRVGAGYEPETVRGHAGRPLRLTFRRENGLASSERVVFPAFGKSVTLPAGEDVTIELLPTAPGEYEFTCGLGVLRGRLVVTADGAPR